MRASAYGDSLCQPATVTKVRAPCEALTKTRPGTHVGHPAPEGTGAVRPQPPTKGMGPPCPPPSASVQLAPLKQGATDADGGGQGSIAAMTREQPLSRGRCLVRRSKTLQYRAQRLIKSERRMSV